MSLPKHNYDSQQISSYIRSAHQNTTIGKGDVVRCETMIALDRLMEGYTGYTELSDDGKKLMIEKKLKSPYDTYHLPNYLYGIVSNSYVNALDKNYLEVFKINFNVETLLKGINTECVSKVHMWEYNVKLVQKKHNGSRVDESRHRRFYDMFFYHPIRICWFKKICKYCRGTNCQRLNNVRTLIIFYDAIEGKPYYDVTKKLLIKTFCYNLGITQRCVDMEVEEMYPERDDEPSKIGYVSDNE